MTSIKFPVVEFPLEYYFVPRNRSTPHSNGRCPPRPAGVGRIIIIIIAATRREVFSIDSGDANFTRTHVALPRSWRRMVRAPRAARVDSLL